MRASVAFSLIAALVPSPVSAQELILEASSSLYSHAGGRWTEHTRAEQVLLLARDTLAIVHEASWSMLRLPIAGGAPAPLSALDTFDRGKNTLLPVHLASDGTLYTSVIKYDRLPLYELRANAAPRALQAKQGAGDYRFLDDGSYLYVERPGMGKAESRHFSDMIIGQTMTLYLVSAAGKKEELLEAPGLSDPRFVDEATLIVYWKPGRVDEDANKKTWILESLDPATKTTRRLAEYDDVLFAGESTSLRFSPQWFSWEDSPWLVFPKSAHESSVVMFNARTHERHAFSVPAGWHLVPRLAGPVRGPSLIVASRGRTIRVVSVPHLKPLLETKAPSAIGRIERGIFIAR